MYTMFSGFISHSWKEAMGTHVAVSPSPRPVDGSSVPRNLPCGLVAELVSWVLRDYLLLFMLSLHGRDKKQVSQGCHLMSSQLSGNF